MGQLSANTGLLHMSTSEQSDRADGTGVAGLGVDGCERRVSSHAKGCWADDFRDSGAVDVHSESPCQLRHATCAAAQAGNVFAASTIGRAMARARGCMKKLRRPRGHTPFGGMCAIVPLAIKLRV